MRHQIEERDRPTLERGDVVSLHWDWACEVLKRKHEKPFFLGVGLYAPHFPNYAPKKYFDLYDISKIEPPPYRDDDLDDLPEKMRRIKMNRKRRHHDRLVKLGAVRQAIHGYLAAVSYADAMLGRVLKALRESPHAENTLIVFWSDHGYHHGEKGDWGKHTLWERTSNVPFLWAGPGVAVGQRCDATVSLIDMYPTFVELCDLPQPRQRLEGTSLATTLAKPAAAKDRHVFLPHMNPGEYAIISRDWRYIRYGEDGEELYDSKADPNEWTNLASRPEHEALKARMRTFAPAKFAKPGTKLNVRRNLVLEGETFRWDTNPPRRPPRRPPQK